MAAETYNAKVIVLRKTKLGESDLILNFLAEDGSQLRAVAKGARKPTSSFAARLELYSVAEILCSKGRSLDIVKEARLLASNDKLRYEMAYAAGAAPMVELLDKVTQRGLASPRLFEMTCAAFAVLNAVAVEAVPSLAAAHLLKTLAFNGLRPSLVSCAVCGSSGVLEGSESQVRISYTEGGILCAECATAGEGVLVQKELCKWAEVLLTSTFTEIAAYEFDAKSASAVLAFCQVWVREHVGSTLKSLDFLLSCNLFE